MKENLEKGESQLKAQRVRMQERAHQDGDTSRMLKGFPDQKRVHTESLRVWRDAEKRRVMSQYLANAQAPQRRRSACTSAIT